MKIMKKGLATLLALLMLISMLSGFSALAGSTDGEGTNVDITTTFTAPNVLPGEIIYATIRMDNFVNVTTGIMVFGIKVSFDPDKYTLGTVSRVLPSQIDFGSEEFPNDAYTVTKVQASGYLTITFADTFDSPNVGLPEGDLVKIKFTAIAGTSGYTTFTTASTIAGTPGYPVDFAVPDAPPADQTPNNKIMPTYLPTGGVQSIYIGSEIPTPTPSPSPTPTPSSLPTPTLIIDSTSIDTIRVSANDFSESSKVQIWAEYKYVDEVNSSTIVTWELIKTYDAGFVGDTVDSSSISELALSKTYTFAVATERRFTNGTYNIFVRVKDEDTVLDQKAVSVATKADIVSLTDVAVDGTSVSLTDGLVYKDGSSGSYTISADATAGSSETVYEFKVADAQVEFGSAYEWTDITNETTNSCIAVLSAGTYIVKALAYWVDAPTVIAERSFKLIISSANTAYYYFNDTAKAEMGLDTYMTVGDTFALDLSNKSVGVNAPELPRKYKFVVSEPGGDAILTQIYSENAQFTAMISKPGRYQVTAYITSGTKSYDDALVSYVTVYRPGSEPTPVPTATPIPPTALELAQAATEKALETRYQDDKNAALVLVNALESGIEKDALLNLLAGITSFNTPPEPPTPPTALELATAAVVKAEASKLGADVDSATILVVGLTDPVEKADLLSRLSAIVKVTAGSASGTVTQSVNSGVPSETATTVVVDDLVTFNAVGSGLADGTYEYSFWKLDVNGYREIKSWSSNGTFSWKPIRAGNYTIFARIKGSDSGSYELQKSFVYNVAGAINVGTVTFDLDKNSGEAPAKLPIILTATASGTGNYVYRFEVSDTVLGTATIKNFSAENTAVWVPRKPGTYTLTVRVQDVRSAGYGDVVESITEFVVTQ